VHERLSSCEATRMFMRSRVAGWPRECSWAFLELRHDLANGGEGRTASEELLKTRPRWLGRGRAAREPLGELRETGPGDAAPVAVARRAEANIVEQFAELSIDVRPLGASAPKRLVERRRRLRLDDRSESAPDVRERHHQEQAGAEPDDERPVGGLCG